MAVKKSTRKKKASKRKAGKKKSAPSVRNLINDAISNPGIRSALYKNPRAVAKQYGMKREEGKAMEILKRSLLSSLDRNQVKQLEAIIQLPAASSGWGGCNPSCQPASGCAPDSCNPNLICPPSPCGPDCAPLPCNPKTL
jgi:hypothetical protein